MKKLTSILLAAVFTMALAAPSAIASEGTIAVQPTMRSSSNKSSANALPKGMSPRSDVPEATTPVIEVDHDNARLLVRYKASGGEGHMVRVIASDGSYDDFTLYAVNADEYFPLTKGNGNYEVWVIRVANGKGQLVQKTNVALKAKDKNAAYLSSNYYVNWEGATDAQGFVNSLAGGKQSKGGDALATSIYQEVVNMMHYDYDSYMKLNSGYMADIDTTLKTKKGVCLDISTLLAGMLRYSDVPTRLAIGYSKEVGTDVQHAWNEAYIDGKWVVIDATYDAIYQKGGHDYKMVKNPKDFKALKTY